MNYILIRELSTSREPSETIKLIKEDNLITIASLTAQIAITQKGIRYHLNKL